MRKIYIFISSFFLLNNIFSQDLPKGWGVGEKDKMSSYLENIENTNASQKTFINTPPQHTALRNAAEWEEIQTLTITWTSYAPIHRLIVKAAQNDTKITIICSDSNAVKSSLTSNSIPLTNCRFIVAPFNS